MEAKFKQFIDKLETTDNKLLIEAIQSGFNAIFEGYADVRDVETEDALTMFNRQAANVAMGHGNPVLQFLQNSAEKTSQMYTFDDEDELDDYDTIDYRDYISSPETSDALANNLGLSASDLSISTNDQGIGDFDLDF
jgi:hypothetical protein